MPRTKHYGTGSEVLDAAKTDTFHLQRRLSLSHDTAFQPCRPGVVCPALTAWNQTETGPTPGYKGLVTRYGPIEAALLLSGPVKSGINKIPCERTLEAWVLMPKFRCLFEERDRTIARSRLIAIGVEATDDVETQELPSWKTDCLCQRCQDETSCIVQPNAWTNRVGLTVQSG
jgi:hypothetical protein